MHTYLRDPLHRNSIVLIMNSASGVVFGLLFWVAAARLFTASDVGVVAALVSASGLVSLLSLLGFDLGLIRFLPAAKDRVALINSCLTLAVVAAVSVSAVYILGTPWWMPELTYLRTLVPSLLFGVATVATTLSLLQGQVFIERRHPEHAWIQTFVSSAARIPLIFAIKSAGPLGIWGAWTGSVLLGALVGSYILSKTEPGYRPIPTISPKLIKGIFPFSFGASLANLANSAPVYLLPLIVISVLGAEANAYYYAGYRIGAVLYSVPWLVAMSLYVEGSHAPGEVHRLSRKALKFALPALALALVLFLVAGPYVLKLFGGSYSTSARWVLWTVSLSAVPYAFNEVYMTIKRVQFNIAGTVYFSVVIGGAVIAASYLLMLKLQLTGAGLGWFVGHLVGMVWVVYRFRLKPSLQLPTRGTTLD